MDARAAVEEGNLGAAVDEEDARAAVDDVAVVTAGESIDLDPEFAPTMF